MLEDAKFKAVIYNADFWEVTSTRDNHGISEKY